MSLVIGNTLEPYGVWFAAGSGSQGELSRARLLLGNVGYLSLEQARGQVSTDALTYSSWCDSLRDAFRKRAFKGGSSVDIDAILKEDRPELTDGEVHMPLACNA